MNARLPLLFTTLATVALVAPPVAAEALVGLTTSGALVRFDSATPGTTAAAVSVSGLQGSESLVGIDRRPLDGALYGLSSASRLYTIDSATGVATPVTGALPFGLSGSSFGFDFNPTVDRIRVTSDADQNLRLNPVSPAGSVADSTLAYGGANAGVDPNVVGSAYTDNRPPTPGVTPTTTLYGIDSNLNALVLQNPPNAGTLNTIGLLGIDVPASLGFDISGLTGLAYLAFPSATGAGSSLYTVNLASGAATLIGQIGTGLSIGGLAAPVGAAVPVPATALLLGLGLAGVVATRRRA